MRNWMRAPLLAVICALLTLGGCDCTDDQPEVEPEEVKADETTDRTPSRDHIVQWGPIDLDIPSIARPYSKAYASGQPSREHFEQLAKVEVDTVVNLRHPDEEGFWSPEEKLDELDIGYVHIPIADVDDLTRENVERLHEVLKESDGAVLVYSAESDRAGAMFALHSDWFVNASPLDALNRGKAAGLDELESDVRRMLYK